MLDTHIYLAFNATVTMGVDAILRNASCGIAYQVTHMNQFLLPTVVGEFSLAVDDCAQWLNGMKAGSRRELMGYSCTDYFGDNFYTELARTQLWALEQGSGWIMWNFKTEKEDNWSYFKSVENGWIPEHTSEIPDWVKGSVC